MSGCLTNIFTATNCQILLVDTYWPSSSLAWYFVYSGSISGMIKPTAQYERKFGDQRGRHIQVEYEATLGRVTYSGQCFVAPRATEYFWRLFSPRSRAFKCTLADLPRGPANWCLRRSCLHSSATDSSDRSRTRPGKWLQLFSTAPPPSPRLVKTRNVISSV